MHEPTMDDERYEPSTPQLSAGRKMLIALAVVAGLAALIALGGWLKQRLSTPDAPHRQVARISILPDTPPPPPPPPPREEPKPQQRDNKPPPPDAAPKAAPVPDNAPIKMEGAAGDGPSPFAAGSVAKDYQGGAPATGPAASAAAGGTGVNSDRAQDRFYAQSARQQLQAEIERHLRGDAAELSASFSVWVGRSGAIERFELLPGSNPRDDADLRAALDETARGLRLAPPPGALTQPMRFRLKVRPQG